MWLTFILEMVKIFGPILIGWLKEWFENRAKEVAATLPAFESYSTHLLAQEAVLRKILEDLPHMAFARRWLIRAMLKHPTGIPAEEIEFVKGQAERALKE